MRPHLPQTVGDLSQNARRCLLGGTDRSSPLPADPFDLDAHLAWYMLNEASFAGWDGVDDEAEWFRDVVRARRRLEAWFIRALTPVLPGDDDASPSTLVSEILGADGPSVSRYLRDHGTVGDLRESIMLRAPYQFKEADPHTFAVPRLDGTVKRALCEIQSGEYGVGHRSTHAELFRAAADALGVGPDKGNVIDRLPGLAFATSNLVSMGGLSRAKRGIVIGQLALFEMDSVKPNGVMVEACDRLGVAAVVRRFFDVHVMADAEHEVIAEQAFLKDYPLLEPDQLDNVRFGIRAQGAIDSATAHRAIATWSAGTSALRTASDLPESASRNVAA